MFASNAVEPQYTDDEGCKEIGSLTVPMPDTKGDTGRRVKEISSSEQPRLPLKAWTKRLKYLLT